MSRLEQLIQELCPNGVAYKPLAEITSMTRGVRVIRSQLSDKGTYPVYQNSMTPLGYYEDSNVSANTSFVISAGAYSTIDFWAADDCFYFVCPETMGLKKEQCKWNNRPK